MTEKKKGLTVHDFSIETIDNARAVVKLGSAETEPLDQADLHRIAKQIAYAVQSTY